MVPLGTPIRGRDGATMDSVLLKGGTDLFIRKYLTG